MQDLAWMWEVPFFVPVNTALICVSVDPLKCPVVYKPRARRWVSSPSSSHHSSRQPLHTHTHENGIIKHVFQAKPEPLSPPE